MRRKGESYFLSIATGSDGLQAKSRLLNPVIWRFLGDDDVMHVTLAESGGGDTNETRLVLHLFNGATAAIAHACLEAAYELVHKVGEGSFRGNTAFDSFRNQLLCGI